jgi:superfamily II RNA helicase
MRTLTDRLPSRADSDTLYEAFVEYTTDRGLELYPAQEEALLEIVSGANVIVSTPTGSGKSMIAVAAHFAAMAYGQRTFYTAPLKALVSEKFFDLCEIFGAEHVGMMTGDVGVNPDAPIICCTAEILANLALRQGAQTPVHQVVMDEFHFYADPDRGWAWQVPLLELPNVQFILLSATLGDVTFFKKDLTERTGRETAVVTSAERPIPLFHRFSLTPMQETLEELLNSKQAPIYLVHFSQAAAVEQAGALMSVNMCTRAEKDAIAEKIGNFRFSAGFGRTLSRLVKHGIGVHHAGMLPKYRRLVEQLAQSGLLKVICGTDTLGVGINVPIRTVVLTSLSKYDGTRTRLLNAREFHQVAGRAGRAGYDTSGYVVVQAPEHVIENEKALAKAGDDPKKRRKVVKKKPPEGFVSYGEPTFTRLVGSEPESLASSFSVSNAMLLNVINRPGDAFVAMRKLLTENHESPASQRKLALKAIKLYRALRTAEIVEQLDEPDEQGRRFRLTGNLQVDFALNQALSPFALEVIDLLSKDTVTYALDVVSVIEATVDNPNQVLHAQRKKAKGDAVQQMKADGIDYEERMTLLENVTWPRPLAEELLEPALETYRQSQPWVSDYELEPKSVVRDFYERAMNFGEYVQFYGLARSEGVLLRYLADVYRALRQTVPTEAKTEELDDLIEWLGATIRTVDSSLLEEWEQLTEPGEETGTIKTRAEVLRPVTGNRRAFTVMIRNELFRRVLLAAKEDYDALADLDGPDIWDDALDDYYEEYESIEVTANARGPKMLVIDEQGDTWHLRQIIEDPEGNHDWAITATVNLPASDAQGELSLKVTAFTT